MTKKLFKRLLPDAKNIKNHQHLKALGNFIHDPNLWHLNRYSVSAAFSVGLFAAFVPIPFQMVLAAFLAVIFRSNLPISVALVWLTNPFTMAPLFYLCYKVGAFVLQMPVRSGFHFELTLQWIYEQFSNIGAPFLLGSLIVGLGTGTLCNILVRLYWRFAISKQWKARRKERHARKI